MQLDFLSKSYCPGQNCEGNNGNQPTEKSYYKTKAYVICLNSFHLSVFDNQYCSEAGNSYYNN